MAIETIRRKLNHCFSLAFKIKCFSLSENSEFISSIAFHPELLPIWMNEEIHMWILTFFMHLMCILFTFYLTSIYNDFLLFIYALCEPALITVILKLLVICLSGLWIIFYQSRSSLYPEAVDMGFILMIHASSCLPYIREFLHKLRTYSNSRKSKVVSTIVSSCMFALNYLEISGLPLSLCKLLADADSLLLKLCRTK